MLIRVLRDAAAASPDKPAVIARSRTVTYAALVSEAEAVAHGLQAESVTRFGICAQDAVDVVVLLAAASAIGAEACVYPRDLDAAAVDSFAQRLEHDVVVADSADAGLAAARTLAFGALAREGGALGEPESTPQLILTTGTSGVPKGVRHDWARLVGAVHRSDNGDGRWLLAYNVNQFAGFQVLLHAFVHAATVVIPLSSHARDAMAALRDHGVTHVSATPTFWRLLVGGLDPEAVDGLKLRQITLGGEAAPDTLIERLRELFAGARISHVYAGTEFGSAVAVGDGQAGLPLSVLDRPEDAAVRFRVVDGELQVCSRNAMLGYHGAAEAEQWLSTGDLVEERDGRLMFVGRTVEIINVGGAKVHPLPIEELVSAVPGVVLSAVYGAPNAITGQIVAVDVVAADGADQDAIKAQIKEACLALPAPRRPRRVKFVENLEVRGGKTYRVREGATA